jgi:uncharacterized protein
MRTDQRRIPAPADLEVGLVRIPEGQDLVLDFRLESVLDGVLVTGTVTAPVQGECARCLESVADVLTADFQELFRYPDDEGLDEGEGDGGVGEDAQSDYHLEGEWIDLEPVIRDALVPTLPDSPLCREDCPGLCAECGVKLADAGPDHRHEGPVDPRWASLRGLGTATGE